MRDLGENQRELVPSDPGHGVALADAAAESRGDRLQEGVSYRMASRVVDDFKAVEVEEQERKQFPLATRPGQTLAQPIESQQPVGEARQAVVQGHVADVELRALSLGGMEDRSRQRGSVVL